MSDHGDTPYPQTDITDLYVFQKPGDPTRSIFILNVNPDAPRQATTFDSEASYEVKIDTNADTHADIAFHVLFATSDDGQRQFATVYRATGDEAEGTGATGQVIVEQAPVSFDGEVRVADAGGYRFYAGLRSDPFAVDLGFFDKFRWTGQDLNGDKNVFGTVLEVPNEALGTGHHLDVWARTMAPIHGELHQIDRVGFAATGVFISAEHKDAFHGSHPSQHLEMFFADMVASLQPYGFSEAEAATLTREYYLPDVMRYDYSAVTLFPNGRNLADDILGWFARLATRGQAAPPPVERHTDLLSDFPYLGAPHPVNAD